MYGKYNNVFIIQLKLHAISETNFPNMNQIKKLFCPNFTLKNLILEIRGKLIKWIRKLPKSNITVNFEPYTHVKNFIRILNYKKILPSLSHYCRVLTLLNL